MSEYLLVLTPKEPIRVGEAKAGSGYLDTLGYIPGSVLRGALAEWLKAQGNGSAIVPIVRRMRFGNFLPSESESAVPLPFPTTALECKQESGFRKVPRGSAKQKGHGIRDSLLIAVAYSELERRGARFPMPLLLRCTYTENERRCGARMDRVSGFYVQLPEGWKKVGVEKGLQTKVALSRHRRAAQEQMLYRVVGLRPHGVFIGRVWADDPSLVDLLKTAVAEMGIGGLTTRGFGTAELQEATRIRPLPSLRDRLQAFNRALREVWADLADLARQVGHNVPAEPEGIYFSVDLLGPAVLRDPQTGLPTMKLRLEIGGQLLEPIWWAVQPAFVGGFSTAWGLPKPTALGVARGSVYVFRCDIAEDVLIPELERMEAQGVGERTDEGLGEVWVCHPFHQEVRPV